MVCWECLPLSLVWDAESSRDWWCIAVESDRQESTNTIAQHVTSLPFSRNIPHSTQVSLHWQHSLVSQKCISFKNICVPVRYLQWSLNIHSLKKTHLSVTFSVQFYSFVVIKPMDKTLTWSFAAPIMPIHFHCKWLTVNLILDLSFFYMFYLMLINIRTQMLSTELDLHRSVTIPSTTDYKDDGELTRGKVPNAWM